MAEKRRKYTKEFKAEAVRLLAGGDRSLAQIARDIGVSDTTLWGWAHRRSKAGEKVPSAASMTETEEVRQLRRENALLREEREILKKAMAFFARESK
jgi:transposase